MKERKIFVLNIILWSVLGISAFLGVIPKTPLKISPQLKANLKILLPERWAFFTKNPKEQYVYLLVQEDTTDGFKLHKNFPNSNKNNFFGIVNNQKAVGLEYGILSSKIPEDLWYEYNDGEDVRKILTQDTIKTLEIDTPLKEPILIGEVVFLLLEPVPYEWRNSVNQYKMPCRFVKLHIKSSS